MELENQQVFTPNPNVPFSERFQKLKDELMLLADTCYKLYFDSRNDEIDYHIYSHRLWHYIQPEIGKDGGKPIAVLYLKFKKIF